MPPQKIIIIKYKANTRVKQMFTRHDVAVTLSSERKERCKDVMNIWFDSHNSIIEDLILLYYALRGTSSLYQIDIWVVCLTLASF